MHLLFLDGSGQIDQGGLFALGGSRCGDSDWPEFRRIWHETVSEESHPTGVSGYCDQAPKACIERSWENLRSTHAPATT